MIWILLIATAVLTIGSACFSGFENGMMAIRQPRLNHALANNSRAARLVKYLLDRPSSMLAAVLLGNNLCNSSAAILFDKMSTTIYSSVWMTTIASGVLTVLVLIFGEITPKVWFRQKPYVRCSYLIYPMTVFYWVSWPFIQLLTGFVAMLNRLVPSSRSSGAVSPALMREDFRMMLEESRDQGLIDSEASALMDNALDYHNATVADRMIPRDQVNVAHSGMTMAELIELAERTGISRFPVTAKDQTDGAWIGTVTVYDAYFRVPRDRWATETLFAWVRPALTISGAAPVSRVLLRASRGTPILIVNDAAGRQIGIVTPADVVTPLIGDLRM